MSAKKARLAAEDLRRRLGLGDLPVDVEKVSQVLGLQVLYEDLGDDISGLLITTDASACICVNQDHPPVRQRFTIAHEIGHYLLRHQFEDGEHVHVDHAVRISARNARSAVGLDPREVEANQFAANLLMPEELVRSRSAKYDLITDTAVSELARDFDVSEQAMEYRLSNLRL